MTSIVELNFLPPILNKRSTHCEHFSRGAVVLFYEDSAVVERQPVLCVHHEEHQGQTPRQYQVLLHRQPSSGL